MKESAFAKRPWMIPAGFGLAAITALVFWLAFNPDNSLGIRIPGTDRGPGADGGQSNPVLMGKVLRGD